MSEDFDHALTDALDQVGRNASPAGPDAARIRGGKRAVRQKIALSTVSLVLVAVGATTAVTLTSSHHDAPQPVTGSPTVSVSASPSGSPSTSPSVSPSQTRTTASSPASSSPADTGSASTSTSQSVTANPQQVQGAAWLSGSEMPFASSMSWNVQSSKTDSMQQLTSTVGYVPNTANFQALTTCGDPQTLMQQTIGAQVDQFDSSPASLGNNQAGQYIFFFSSPEKAQLAFSWLKLQYLSNCSGITSTGAQLTEVANDGAAGMAWLTLKASSGLVDLPLYDREYFVLRGSTIAYVSVTSYPHTLAKTYNDAGELSTIAGHLCVYGGACS